LNASNSEGLGTISWRHFARGASSCESTEYCYFIAFFEGAIDMTPAEKAPENVTASITPADQIEWAEVKGGVKMAVAHGNPKEGAFVSLFEFPAGMTTNVHSHTANFAGALVAGTHMRGPDSNNLKTLSPRSVWTESSGSPHMEKCGPEANCLFAGWMDQALDTKNVELTPTKIE